jgi:integrase
MRVDETKTAPGGRTIPLPRFAVETLTARRGQHYPVSRPRSSRRLPGRCATRTTSASNGALCASGSACPVPSHSFRKTVAALIDDEGLSARIGADHLGHSKVSMTQDRYMSRGRVHAQGAELLDHTINDE